MIRGLGSVVGGRGSHAHGLPCHRHVVLDGDRDSRQGKGRAVRTGIDISGLGQRPLAAHHLEGGHVLVVLADARE